MAQQHTSLCPQCKLMFDSLEKCEDDAFGKKLKEILFGHINDVWRIFTTLYPNYQTMPVDQFGPLFTHVNSAIMPKTFLKIASAFQ